MIGKTGRDISEEDALDYILGYTASNDISARNLQFATTQWSMSKGLDSSCPIGIRMVSKLDDLNGTDYKFRTDLGIIVNNQGSTGSVNKSDL